MKKLLTIFLAMFSLQAFSGTDPKVAYAMVEGGEAVIIDVREADEIESGMIKGALWFPLSKVQSDKDWKKDFEKLVGEKKIFLHCRSGNRSEKVMNILKDHGIPSENLGGYEALKKVLPVREVGIR